MQLSPSTLYALKLSLQQAASSSMLRRSMAERSTTTSAAFLVAVGFSMSLFSLKQMFSSQGRHHGMGRLH